MPAITRSIKPYTPSPAPILENSQRTFLINEVRKIKETLDSLSLVIEEIKEVLEPL